MLSICYAFYLIFVVEQETDNDKDSNGIAFSVVYITRPDFMVSSYIRSTRLLNIVCLSRASFQLPPGILGL